MPQDHVEVVVSLSLLKCHNMVNQSLLVPASLNTKHPFGTRWQDKWGNIRGYSVSAFGPHIKPHGSEEASKSSGGVLIAPKILGVRAN